MQKISTLSSETAPIDIGSVDGVFRTRNTDVNSSELYLYTLKLLILEYINEPRFQEKYTSRSSLTSSQAPASKIEKHSRRVSWFSGSPAPIKERSEFEILQKILPKLEKYLGNVAIGKNKLANDKLRRSFLKFYNDVFLNPVMTDTLRSMERFEELIVHFTKAANGELNKLEVDNIQKELYKEVSYFIDVLIEMASSGITGELKTKLLQYKDSAKPGKSSLRKVSNGHSAEASNLDTISVTVKPSFRLNEITHSLYFKELFKVDEVNLQQDIIKILSETQNKTFCHDLLLLKKNITKDKGPLKIENFPSERLYENWKAYEIGEIASLLDKFNYNDALTKNKSTSKSLVLIPKNSRDLFVSLLSRIFEKESAYNMGTLGLSQTGLFFLTRASRYWRIDFHSTLASLTYSAANRSILNDEELNVKLAENLFSFVRMKILRFEDNTDTAAWNDIDQKLWLTNLHYTLEQCFNSIDNLLSALYSSTRPKFSPILSFYYTYIETDPAMISFRDETGLNNTGMLKKLHKTIFKASEDFYISLLNKVPKDDSIEIQDIQNVAEMIVEQIKSIQKRYSKPLLDSLNLSFECATVLIEAFASDALTMIKRVEKYHKAKTSRVIAPVDALETYSVFKELRSIYWQIKPDKPFPCDIEKLFSTYLNQLCNEVCAKIPRVITAAFQNENWEPVNSEINFSSSVIDVFKMINESITMFKKLEWEDMYQNAKVITHLLKSFSDGLHTYSSTILHLIEDDLMQDASELQLNEEDNKEKMFEGRLSSDTLRTWSFTDVKNALKSTPTLKAPKPYQFKKRTCVLLNDLDSMIQKINGIEEQVKAEQLSEIISDHEHNSKDVKGIGGSSKQTLYQIYTIRVVGAENIKGYRSDGLSNAFVSLVDTNKQHEIGKTRVFPKSINPTWDEEFEIDIPVDKSRSIALTVWHRSQGKLHHLGSYHICGKCSLSLDHRKFTDDGFPNEIAFDLDTQGKLYLEVSLESEKMDPLFCIGRTYRTLVRARDRAIELITNKFLTFVNYAFSRATLRTVCGNNGTTPAAKEVVCDAIVPLFDYLNSNLSIVAPSLSQDLFFKIMIKAWSCILKAADALLLPQLSMAKHRKLKETKSRWENAVSTALGNAPTVSGYGRALTQREIETVFVWLNSLCIDFFHNGGEGPPLGELKNKHYQTIFLIPAFVDKPVSELKKEVERLSPDYTTYLKQITVANSTNKRLSVRLITLARKGTIMANASKKRRSQIRQQIEEDSNSPLERNAEILDILLRTLIAKGELEYVRKHLSTREKARKKVVTDKLVKAAVKGQKFHRHH